MIYADDIRIDDHIGDHRVTGITEYVTEVRFALSDGSQRIHRRRDPIWSASRGGGPSSLAPPPRDFCTCETEGRCTPCRP